jgi:2-hydroxycyclohexanecarboxyl-CoA dehydrogenase
VIPFGRLGTAEDLAPVVVFLASDESGFVTGQTLSVSGGLTMI